MDAILEFLLDSARIIALLIMVVTLVGMVIPVFPGTTIIWVVAIIYAFIVGLDTFGWIIIAILTILAVVGGLADNVLMGAKAKEKGASCLSIGLALAAGVIFTLTFPPIGGLIATPLVLFGMEYWRLKDRDEAVEVTKALMIGMGWSFVARFGIGLLMVIMWSLWSFSA